MSEPFEPSVRTVPFLAGSLPTTRIISVLIRSCKAVRHLHCSIRTDMLMLWGGECRPPPGPAKSPPGRDSIVTTYSFENGQWDGAEVFAWSGGDGAMIGRAHFSNEISAEPRVTVRLDNGRERGGFTTADEALAWIEENA